MEPIITTTDSMPVTTIIETYKNGILIERKTEMRNAYV